MDLYGTVEYSVLCTPYSAEVLSLYCAHPKVLSGTVHSPTGRCWPVMSAFVRYCPKLYAVQNCPVLPCTVRCMVLFGSVRHTELNALQYCPLLYGNFRYCTELYGNFRYCTALYGTVMCKIVFPLFFKKLFLGSYYCRAQCAGQDRPVKNHQLSGKSLVFK